MIAIKPFLLLLSLVFIQGIQSYCVYNNFTDGIAFNIHQTESGAPFKKAFDKNIESGSRECCPYTEKHCSYNQVQDEKARFIVTFNDYDIPYAANRRVAATCTTGGALVIGGTGVKYFAECFDINGNFFDALLFTPE